MKIGSKVDVDEMLAFDTVIFLMLQATDISGPQGWTLDQKILCTFVPLSFVLFNVTQSKKKNLATAQIYFTRPLLPRFFFCVITL